MRQVSGVLEVVKDVRIGGTRVATISGAYGGVSWSYSGHRCHIAGCKYLVPQRLPKLKISLPGVVSNSRPESSMFSVLLEIEGEFTSSIFLLGVLPLAGQEEGMEPLEPLIFDERGILLSHSDTAPIAQLTMHHRWQKHSEDMTCRKCLPSLCQ